MDMYKYHNQLKMKCASLAQQLKVLTAVAEDPG